MTDKASSGQPIRNSPLFKASFLNDVIDTVKSYKDSELGDQGGARTTPRTTDQVKVLNRPCHDRLRGNVVQIGNQLFDEIDPRNPWFQGNVVAEPVTS